MSTLGCNWIVGVPSRLALRDVMTQFGYNLVKDDGKTLIHGTLLATQDCDAERDVIAISLVLQLARMRRPAVITIAATQQTSDLSQKIRRVLPEFLIGLGLKPVAKTEEEAQKPVRFYVFIERDDDYNIVQEDILEAREQLEAEYLAEKMSVGEYDLSVFDTEPEAQEYLDNIGRDDDY